MMEYVKMGRVTLTSRSSFHGISESAEALLAPFMACLFVEGARSSTLWLAGRFLSSILMMVEEAIGATVEAAFIRKKEAGGNDAKECWGCVIHSALRMREL